MKIEHNGWTAEITVEQDQCGMGAPWEEHDGHGEVTGWERRDKRPGEWILCGDRGAKRFYNFAGAMKTARADGWGIGDEALAVLERGLGRKATKGEVFEAAVKSDFEYLAGWANDRWTWLCYSTEITSPDGRTFLGDSCGGLDDGKYLMEAAKAAAVYEIDRLILTDDQTALAGRWLGVH